MSKLKRFLNRRKDKQECDAFKSLVLLFDIKLNENNGILKSMLKEFSECRDGQTMFRAIPDRYEKILTIEAETHSMLDIYIHSKYALPSKVVNGNNLLNSFVRLHNTIMRDTADFQEAVTKVTNGGVPDINNEIDFMNYITPHLGILSNCLANYAYHIKECQGILCAIHNLLSEDLHRVICNFDIIDDYYKRQDEVKIGVGFLNLTAEEVRATLKENNKSEVNKNE